MKSSEANTGDECQACCRRDKEGPPVQRVRRRLEAMRKMRVGQAAYRQEYVRIISFSSVRMVNTPSS